MEVFKSDTTGAMKSAIYAIPLILCLFSCDNAQRSKIKINSKPDLELRSFASSQGGLLRCFFDNEKAPGFISFNRGELSIYFRTSEKSGPFTKSSFDEADSDDVKSVDSFVITNQNKLEIYASHSYQKTVNGNLVKKKMTVRIDRKKNSGNISTFAEEKLEGKPIEFRNCQTIKKIPSLNSEKKPTTPSDEESTTEEQE